MRLPQSPLVGFTLIGIIAGLAVGIFVVLTTHTPTRVDAVVYPGQTFHETRIQTGWKFTKIPREDDPTKFDYDVTESEYAYTVPVPAGSAAQKEPPIWEDMISIQD
jgi:small-conductance mechanosensitive channel